MSTPLHVSTPLSRSCAGDECKLLSETSKLQNRYQYFTFSESFGRKHLLEKMALDQKLPAFLARFSNFFLSIPLFIFQVAATLAQGILNSPIALANILRGPVEVMDMNLPKITDRSPILPDESAKVEPKVGSAVRSDISSAGLKIEGDTSAASISSALTSSDTVIVDTIVASTDGDVAVSLPQVVTQDVVDTAVQIPEELVKLCTPPEAFEAPQTADMPQTPAQSEEPATVSEPVVVQQPVVTPEPDTNISTTPGVEARITETAVVPPKANWLTAKNVGMAAGMGLLGYLGYKYFFPEMQWVKVSESKKDLTTVWKQVEKNQTTCALEGNVDQTCDPNFAPTRLVPGTVAGQCVQVKDGSLNTTTGEVTYTDDPTCYQWKESRVGDLYERVACTEEHPCDPKTYVEPSRKTLVNGECTPTPCEPHLMDESQLICVDDILCGPHQFLKADENTWVASPSCKEDADGSPLCEHDKGFVVGVGPTAYQRPGTGWNLCEAVPCGDPKTQATITCSTDPTCTWEGMARYWGNKGVEFAQDAWNNYKKEGPSEG